MTNQEKATNEAKQLVDKHYSELADLGVMEEVLDQVALNQALITVSKTLEALNNCDDECGGVGLHIFRYWNMVEEELMSMGAC